MSANLTCPICRHVFRPTKGPGSDLVCPACHCIISKQPAAASPPLPLATNRTILGEPEPTMRFGCPRCKKGLEVPVSAAGTKLNCASCGQRLQVPHPPARPMPTTMNQTVLGHEAVRVEEPAAPPVRLKPARSKRARSRPTVAASEMAPLVPTKLLVALGALLGGIVVIGSLVAILVVLIGRSRSPERVVVGPVADLQPTPTKTAVVPDGSGVVPATPTLAQQGQNEFKPISPEEALAVRIPFHALGSRERLAAIKVVQIEGKARFRMAKNINDLRLTWESLRRLKFVENQPWGRKVMVLEGDTARVSMDGISKVLDGDGLSFYQNFSYSFALSNLLPLKEKQFNLSNGANATVRGRECYSVRVSAGNRPEMLLFFERKSELLAKTQFRGKFLDPRLKFSGPEMLVECYFSDYRKVDGVNHWWRTEQFRDGAPYADMRLDSVRFFDMVDDAMFSFE